MISVAIPAARSNRRRTLAREMLKRGCTLLELAHGQCRWPINEPGADNFCFCGNEAFQALPYCVGHARLAYRSTRSA